MKPVIYVFLAAVLIVGLQQWRLSNLQESLADQVKETEKKSGQLEKCKLRRDDLIASIEEQSEKIKELKELEEERAEAAKQEQRSARAESEKDYQAANRIQQETTGGDACQAAVSVIDRELGL